MKKSLFLIPVLLLASFVSAGNFIEIDESMATFNMPLVVNGNVESTGTIKAESEFIGKANNVSADLSYKFYNETTGDPIQTGFRCHTGEMNALVFYINGVAQFKVGTNQIETLGTTITKTYPGFPGQPGYTFAGDDNTGMFRELNDTLSFSGGAQRLLELNQTRAYSYKPVLIGTTTMNSSFLRANGAIESISGGFVFPDSTVQTTAAQPYSGCEDHGALSSAPSSPNECDRYYDTGTNQMMMWNGTVWVILG